MDTTNFIFWSKHASNFTPSAFFRSCIVSASQLHFVSLSIHRNTRNHHPHRMIINHLSGIVELHSTVKYAVRIPTVHTNTSHFTMAYSCGCGWPHTHTNLTTINAHTYYHPPFTLMLILHRHCHRHEHDLLTFFIPRFPTGIHLLFSQMTLDFLSFLIFLEIGT